MFKSAYGRAFVNGRPLKLTVIIPKNEDEPKTHPYHLNKAIYPKEHSLKIVKMPKPMRMVWGSLVAYWLAGIINPAFVAIAMMIALFIPVFIVDPLFPGRPQK